MTAPRIAKNIARPVPKQRDGMSNAHLAMIRLCPCLGCGREARGGYVVDPHHLMRLQYTDEGKRGLSLKAADKWAVPMCRAIGNALAPGCHDEVTANTNDDEWFAARELGGREVARSLWGARGEGLEAYRRIILAHRDRARLRAIAAQAKAAD